MPDVWPAFARQGFNCEYEDTGDGKSCDQGFYVKKGDPCVQMRVSRKIHTWHPACWLLDAFRLLRENPRALQRQGRKPLDMDPEDRHKRDSIIRLRAAYRQRLRIYEDRRGDLSPANLEINELRIKSYKLKIAAIWVEVQGYGGPPESWEEPVELTNIESSVE